MNRLLWAKEAPTAGGADTWRQTYTYLDAAGQNGQFGNRRVDTGLDPATQQPRTTPNATPQHNPQVNPLTNRFADNQGYAYDAAGNLKQDPSHAYAYDAENKLATVDGGWNGTSGASYQYDGDGRRVKKVSASETTVFVYDALGRAVAEYSNQVQYAGARYLMQDHLGSTRVVTDSQGNAHSENGAKGARHDYFPFGEQIQAGVGGRATQQGYSAADNVRQKFTGQERDTETGLDYFRARYYSSTQGRFTSVDPSRRSISAANPQTWNRYQYCNNNPLKLVDKNGKWPTPTHNEILKKAFPTLNETLLAKIQKGSKSVDLDGANPKTLWEKNAPQHAMTPGSAVRRFNGDVGKAREWAKNEANIFINDNMKAARQLMSAAKDIHPEQRPAALQGLETAMKKDFVSNAMNSFGQGAHTIMDSYSPAHRDFQVYDTSPYKIIAGVAGPITAGIVYGVDMVIHSHDEGGMGGDREPTYAERDAMVEALRSQFKQSFGEEWYNHAVNGGELPREAR